MKAIHQLLPSFDRADAIGGCVQKVRTALIAAGYESLVFAPNYHSSLRSITRDSSDLAHLDLSDAAVIYHYSIGSPLADEFVKLETRRVVWYHNITPSHYFEAGSPLVQHNVEYGRQQLPLLAARADAVIADSQYNLGEFQTAGGRDGTVIAAFDAGRLRSSGDKVERDPNLILCVGRLAPNKRQDVLIRALAVLREVYNPQAHLVLVGNATDTDLYRVHIEKLVHKLDMGDAVKHVALSDQDLAKIYQRASVYASASEHEGFCVPITEAFTFDLPVVAFAAGATPETLGGGGLLLHSHDPFLWAETLHRVMRDSELRRVLAARGKEQLVRFSHGDLGKLVIEAISGR